MISPIPSIVIRNGNVIDGTGAPARQADIAVSDNRIVAVGQVPETSDAIELDATGLTVTPGFIDIHSHSDYTLLVDPRAISSIAQGVTLEVIGNCGWGCQPIIDPALSKEIIYGFDGSIDLTWRTTGEYLEALQAVRPAVNVATLVPNGQLRLATIGFEERPASKEEIATMSRLLSQGLEGGAFGYSTGLEYATETHAPESEVTTLCRIVARAEGLYATHVRNRDEAAVEAIAEAIRTARNAEVQLQISHLTPRRGHDDLARSLDLVSQARARGMDIAFDMHTRLFGTVALKVVLPQWAFEGGKAELCSRLQNPEARRRMKTHRSLISALGDWNRVVLFDCHSHPEFSRRSIADIARERDAEPMDAIYDLLLDEIDMIESHPMVMLLSYDEELLGDTYRHPLCMVASDATALAPDGPLSSSTFHGSYTWASWFYRRMVRETETIAEPEAIHKLTGMPAQVLGLDDRGIITEGAYADIAVFDPELFGERGTTFSPNQPAVGMRYVIVNGMFAVREGTVTNDRAGNVIRRGYVT